MSGKCCERREHCQTGVTMQTSHHARVVCVGNTQAGVAHHVSETGRQTPVVKQWQADFVMPRPSNGRVSPWRTHCIGGMWRAARDSKTCAYIKTSTRCQPLGVAPGVAWSIQSQRHNVQHMVLPSLLFILHVMGQ